jgi:hypothetical protein
LTLQAVACGAQSVAKLQATQAPLPLQTEPPLSVHVVPAGAELVPHAPEVQVFVLHAVVCWAQSVEKLHATQAPVPLQTDPPLSAQGVPALALTGRHVWDELQTLAWHRVSGWAQSESPLHCTQTPLPLQTLPPLSPHPVP